jgi:hypothetical protein
LDLLRENYPKLRGRSLLLGKLTAGHLAYQIRLLGIFLFPERSNLSVQRLDQLLLLPNKHHPRQHRQFFLPVDNERLFQLL